MDWTPIIAGGVGLLAGATPKLVELIGAYAKKKRAEADAVTIGATARDREVTAKVKLIEAEAAEKKAEADVDSYMVKRVEKLEEDVDELGQELEKCKSDRTAERKERDSMISRLKVLEDKAGLTPPEQLRVAP